MILTVVALLGVLILFGYGVYAGIKYVDSHSPLRNKPRLTRYQVKVLLMKRKP